MLWMLSLPQSLDGALLTTEQARKIEPELRAGVQALRDTYNTLNRTDREVGRYRRKQVQDELSVLVPLHRALVKAANGATASHLVYYAAAVRKIVFLLRNSLTYPCSYPVDSLFDEVAWALPVGFDSAAEDAPLITLQQLYAALREEHSARLKKEAAARRARVAKKQAFLASLSATQREALSELLMNGGVTLSLADLKVSE